MADESGKSQSPSKGRNERNAIKSTETNKTPTGVDTESGKPAQDLNAETITDANGENGTNSEGTLSDDQFNEPVRKVETDDERTAREATEAAAAAAKVTKDVVPAEYRAKYAAGNGTCGDFIATEISTLTKEGGVPALNQLKRENSIAENRWSELNNGMQRMNLANTLRASFLRGDPITIGGRQYSLAASLVEFEGEGDDRDPIMVDDAEMLGKFIRMIDVQDNDRTRSALKKALGPKPEKKARKTPEEREAEKKAKAEALEATRAEKKAKREAETAEKTAARTKAAEEAAATKAKAAAERDEAKKAKDAEKAKAAEAAAAAREQAKAAKEAAKAGKAAENSGEVEDAVANKQAGEDKGAGAVA